LAPWGEATRNAIRPLVPAELTVENPLECGVAGFADEKNYIDILRHVAQDENVDLLALHGELPRPPDKRKPDLFASLRSQVDKPTLAFARVTHGLTEESRAFQEAAGIPFLPNNREGSYFPPPTETNKICKRIV
jgi:acyl-CoA synthetase (NDP forming)